MHSQPSHFLLLLVTLLSLMTPPALGFQSRPPDSDQQIRAEPREETPASTISREEANMEELVAGNTRFSFDLYRELAAADAGENLFFSPYSISMALGMVAVGARGQTWEEMSATLDFKMSQGQLSPSFGELRRFQDSDAYALNIANALWGQKDYPFKESYLNALERDFGTSAYEMDFVRAAENARERINDWVEKETKGKIKDLIQPGFLDASTRLVLTNAIYFKGDWVEEFDEKRTAERDFHVSSSRTVKTPLMSKEARFPFVEKETFKAISLPYKGGDIVMLALLPNDVDGLAALEQSLDTSLLETVQSELSSKKVDVLFPKFKLETSFQLGKTLSQMGMPAAFGSGANLTGISEAEGLEISEVVHKAFVEVDEKGTEAAAATAVGVRATSAMLQKPEFHADHPFMFLLIDQRTNSVLFLGRMVNPAK